MSVDSTWSIQVDSIVDLGSLIGRENRLALILAISFIRLERV